MRRRASTALIAAVALSFAGGSGVSQASDCAGLFPEGRFGIPLSHAAVASGRLPLVGYAPFYLVKQVVAVSRPDDCRYAGTFDVFRMVDSRASGSLLAGCIGDFDGDGVSDIALLLRRQRDGTAVPVVFRARPSGYDVIELDRVTDPYGFNEDPAVWPGPFCLPKPQGGVFRSDVGGAAIVVGDLFTVGWRTYYWNPAARRFDNLLTSD